jgi:acetoin utilization protein AcuB
MVMMPPVSRYMTSKPLTIDRFATVDEAERIMREHAIRHLPVLDGRDLCGIVSDRDLHLVRNLVDTDPGNLRVELAMTDHPFIVTGDTSLDEVVEIMGANKYGSVVVVGHNGVEGIFTAIDACGALAQILRREAQ